MLFKLKTTQPLCLWCLAPFDPYPHLINWFGGGQILCDQCLRRLNYHPRTFKLGSLKVKSYYDYNGDFSSLLIQYKEMKDIALAKVFVYQQRQELLKLAKHHQFIALPCLEYRGFNPVVMMLRSIGIECECYFKKTAAIAQKQLNREGRMKVRFELTCHEFKKKRIILIDDVKTTGASLLAAYRLLTKYPIKIKALVISNQPLLEYNKEHGRRCINLSST